MLKVQSGDLQYLERCTVLEEYDIEGSILIELGNDKR